MAASIPARSAARSHAQLYPELVDRITDLVYLGSRQANTPMMRRALGFTHVVQVSASRRPESCDAEFAEGTHLYLQLDDDEEADALPSIARFLAFATGLAATRGDRLLVHCDAGVSRSATLVIALLMSTEQPRLSFAEALTFVVQRRPVVEPNDGFKAQLERWGATLNDNTVAVSTAKP
jgi:dual specificity phosphatase 12